MPLSGSDGAIAAAISPSLIIRNDAPTFRTSATISLWRGRSSIMTTTSWTRLFSACAINSSVSSIGLSILIVSIPVICMCWITCGP